MTTVSIKNMIKHIINSNLGLAQNGKNTIKLNFVESKVFNLFKIKKTSVELLITNILIMNLKNTMNGIIGIKI